MAYTEIKETNGKRYYYRARSMRLGKKFRKQRIYLGSSLSQKKLAQKEIEADHQLRIKRNNVLDKLIPKIRRILKNNKVRKAGIFGSYALGAQKSGSDIDILIEPPKRMGFGFVRIQFELERKLKKKVDLVTYNGLSPYLKNRILSQEIRIL